MGLREALAEACAPPTKVVDVRGHTVKLVGLSAGELIELSEMDQDIDATLWLLERMVRDPETGERVFTDRDPVLRQMDTGTVDEFTRHVLPLMGIEEQAKNSEAAPSSDT